MSKWVLYWGRYCLIVLGLVLLPGPDNLMVLTVSVHQGSVQGLWLILGLQTSILVHLQVVRWGVAAFLVKHPKLMRSITQFGGCYLLWLAIHALMSSQSENVVEEEIVRSGWAHYRMGVMMSLFNPKLQLFFLSFLPRFLRPDLGQIGRQLTLLGIIFILISGSTFSLMALGGGQIMRFLQAYPTAESYMNMISALFIGALGCWILSTTIQWRGRICKKTLQN